MEWLPSNFLAIGFAAASLLGLGLLAWRIFASRSTSHRLSPALAELTSEHEEELVPLLLIEDTYPAFVEILGAVVAEFDLAPFMERDDFSAAIAELRTGIYSGKSDSTMRAAMCHVVRCFLDDPEVEFRCREPLSRLTDQFLIEIGASDDVAASA